jgi:hypothetical protein
MSRGLTGSTEERGFLEHRLHKSVDWFLRTAFMTVEVIPVGWQQQNVAAALTLYDLVISITLENNSLNPFKKKIPQPETSKQRS